MRAFYTSASTFAFVALMTPVVGCATVGATVEPGHRALYFDPEHGVQHEVLQEGWHKTSCDIFTRQEKCPKLIDFDVTYSTAMKTIHVLSNERLPVDLELTVKYRPIVSELYLLDTEIGTNYFEEVVAPEFNSAATNVFARTSYLDLQKKNREIEDEIEKQLQDRLKGKHVEISSVLIGKVSYAPEILNSLRERVVSQEQTLRNQQLLENEALQKKRQLELGAETKRIELETAATQKKMELAAQTEQKKLELEAEAEQAKISASTKLEVEKLRVQKETEGEKYRIESALRNKQAERRLTAEQAQIDRMKAEGEAAARVAQAKGEASARLALAKASSEEAKASVANVTPMHVMMHAYDALGHLGGSGTTIMLGDYSKVPQFLFPRIPQFQQAVGPWYGGPMFAPPPAPPPAGKVSQAEPHSDNPYP